MTRSAYVYLEIGAALLKKKQVKITVYKDVKNTLNPFRHINSPFE